jgi:hypothetical protein
VSAGRRIFTTLATLVVTTSLMETASAVVPIEPVVTDPGEQWLAYANDTYVVYTEHPRENQNQYSALARPLAGGQVTRLNASGTRGFTGGIDPGTNRVIYQEWTRERGSRLFFYDLDTDQRTKVPGVDAKGFSEWRPVISSRSIMFTRERFRQGAWYDSIHVYERSTGAIRKLGTWEWGPTIVFPGSVGERFAAYTLCNRRNCWAYLYDWDTKTLRRVPSDDGRPQYAPVIDEGAGTLYVSRSANNRCGVGVGIWRMPLDLTGADTKIVALPRGIDTDWSSSLTVSGATGEVDLYLERYDCDRETGDIYVARSVDVHATT